jgi:2-polyprenyl-3-methyl-5-hydroxy-6-metoxy-1,4-benzoquinol methylase
MPQTHDPKERFAFDKNWSNFLNHLTQERIVEAEKSLKKNLGISNLNNKIFLDVGCGSGLFSLAAHRLGAIVFSFDYDEDSVRCTQHLKKIYGHKELEWSITQGSVLDKDFLHQFGAVDILYSWGVLHHTGHMKEAFNNICDMVKSGGHLFISIYNDQGTASKRWLWIKKKYTRSNENMRFLLCLYTLFRQWSITFFKDFLKSGNPLTT